MLSSTTEIHDPLDVAADIRLQMDNYARGEMDVESLSASVLRLCGTGTDAVWEGLAILDQYHRRGVLSDDIFNSLKADVSYLALGSAAKELPGAHQRETDNTSTNEPSPSETAAPSIAALAETPTNAPTPASESQGPPTDTLRDDEYVVCEEDEEARSTNEPASTEAQPRRTQPREEEFKLFDSGETTRAHSLTQGRVLHDRYVIESVLFQGRTSTIFKARDRYRISDMDRFVAIKALSTLSTPDAPAQFENELLVAQRLSHPNIVKGFDIDRDGELLFFTMELVEGKTLTQVMETKLDQSKALAILRKLANALAYMHENKIAHGDVNPDNVMITTTGDVKLLDFGAASNDPSPEPWLSWPTATGKPSSTAIYASFERLEGLPADKRDDIFSLSCIAYQLLGHRHPFGGITAAQAFASNKTPTRPSGVSLQQWRALQQGLAWHRNDRMHSVYGWSMNLEGLGAANNQTPAKASSPASSFAKQNHSPGIIRRRYAVLLAVLLALAAALFLLLDFNPQTSPALATAQSSIKQTTVSAWSRLTASVESDPTPPPTKSSQADAGQTETSTTTAVTEAANNLALVNPEPIVAQPEPDIAAAPITEPIPAATEPSEVAAPPAPTPVSTPAEPKTAQVAPGPGRISFSKDTFVVESGSAAARIEITRVGGSSGKVGFTWWSEGGTAESGRDFMSLGKKTEVLAHGERGITVFVPLIIGRDNTRGHVFFVELEKPTNGLSLGRITRAKVVITDG